MIIFISLILTIGFLMQKSEEVLIPKEAIRFRVIANSNSKEDQHTKVLVRNEIQKQIVEDVKEVKQLSDARYQLQSKVGKYEEIVADTLFTNQITSLYQVDYGLHYFPEKIYKGVKYQEGYYESLVVTLGDGLGDNWWCVLFPPLCLLEAEETEETTEVEYRFFIKEIIDKYLK